MHTLTLYTLRCRGRLKTSTDLNRDRHGEVPACFSRSERLKHGEKQKIRVMAFRMKKVQGGGLFQQPIRNDQRFARRSTCGSTDDQGR